MKNFRVLLLIYFLVHGVYIQAQKVKMDLVECIEMATKNISIKQIELRGLEAEIDKNDAKETFTIYQCSLNHS